MIRVSRCELLTIIWTSMSSCSRRSWNCTRTANIALFKAAEKAGKKMPTPLELSSGSVLSCSYYNQGCEGGYPYLVAKHAMEFGLPQESCMPYGGAGQGHVAPCNADCFKSDDQVVFAKDYNYVG